MAMVFLCKSTSDFKSEGTSESNTYTCRHSCGCKSKMFPAKSKSEERITRKLRKCILFVALNVQFIFTISPIFRSLKPILIIFSFLMILTKQITKQILNSLQRAQVLTNPPCHQLVYKFKSICVLRKQNFIDREHLSERAFGYNTIDLVFFSKARWQMSF